MHASSGADENVPLCHRQQARFAPYHLPRGGGSRRRRANHTDNIGGSSESQSSRHNSRHNSHHSTRSSTRSSGETIADSHGSDQAHNAVLDTLNTTGPRPGPTYTSGQLLGLRFVPGVWNGSLDQVARVAEPPLHMSTCEQPPPYHTLSPPPPAFEARPPPPACASTECQATTGAREGARENRRTKRTRGGRTVDRETNCSSRSSQSAGRGGDGTATVMDEEPTRAETAAYRITLAHRRWTRPLGEHEPAAHTPRQTRSARRVRTSPQGGGPPRPRERRKAAAKTRTL